jgi:predicted permease
VLGVAPQLGRMLTLDDDRGGSAGAAVVLSHGYWQRRFGGDTSVLGKTLQIDRALFTIVGVAPPGFVGLEPGANPDLWWPLEMLPAVDPSELDLVHARPRAGSWLTVLGRLRNGFTREQARAELNVFYHAGLAAEVAERGADWDETRRRKFLEQAIELEAAGSGTGLGRQFARLFGIFALAAGVVLAIACANVAGLLLARGATRAREFAVRSALGAARGRLLRQLVTENLLLAAAGGALGVVFARWGTDAFATYLPQHGRAYDLALDGRVLGFALLASVVSGLIFGLGPALRFSRLDLIEAMKNQSGQRVGRARSRLNHFLVVAQIALSVMLLAGAGLFLRTLRNLRALDLGFRRENVVLFSLDFPRGYDASQRGDVHARLLHVLETLPGVRRATLSGAGIMSGDILRTRFSVDGYTPGPDERLQVSAVVVGPHFFETLRIPLLRGREITWADISSTNAGTGAQPVVISESMARRFFADTDPIGRTIRHGGQGQPLEIIGVAKDTKYQNLREKTPLEYYLPYAGSLMGFFMTVHVSTTSAPAALELNLRPIVRQIDPRVTLKDVRTLEETIDRTIVPERVIAKLACFFSVFALTLASLGLYGVLSYGVTQRAREIGVRMALGAGARDVVALVVRQGLMLAVIGCALGLLGAAALTRLIADLLYGVAPNDPTTLLTTVAVLISVAMLACWLPARRAAKVDPMVALRYE